jgi:hypothetical protein
MMRRIPALLLVGVPLAFWGSCDCDNFLGGGEGEGEGEGEEGEGEGGGGEGEGEGEDPLESSLERFCRGSGAVVDVGAGGVGNVCAGDLAEDIFQFAICACTDLTVGSRLTVDAFDSAIGPYTDQAARLEDGQLGFNGGPLVVAGVMDIRGSAFIGGGNFGMGGANSAIRQNLVVFGDLTNGPNSGATIGRNAFINGNVGNNYTITGTLALPEGRTLGNTSAGSVVRRDISQVLPCPCEDNQILDIAGIVASAADRNDNDVVDLGIDPADLQNGGTVTLEPPCGRFYIPAPGVNTGSMTIIVKQRLAIFVDGDFTTAGIDIRIEDDGELDLFINGDLDIDAAATFGLAAAPARFRVYVAGDVAFQANTILAGNLYAPRADISFGAAAEVFGSVFSGAVRFSGNSSVHFDSAIRVAGDDCIEPGEGEGEGEGAPGEGEGEGEGAPGEGECEGEGEPTGPPPGECSVDRCRDDLDCCPPLLCSPDINQCFGIGG